MGDLGALPVPLADGRLVRGPRGLLLPGPGLGRADALGVLGLRVVHPDAAHPLLGRLGAVQATPRGVLADPAVRAAVAASADETDPEPIADAVLGLAAAARLRPGDLPWLAELALPGTDGDWYPADELLLPGGPLAGVVAADAPFGTASPEILARHGAEALEAVGVLATFGLLTATDVALDDPDLDLDGAAGWAADVRGRAARRCRPAGGGRGGGGPRPGTRRPGPLAAGPGPAVPAAAAGRADRARPGPAGRRPPRRRGVLHRLVAAPGAGPGRPRARPGCGRRAAARCWPACTTSFRCRSTPR